MTRRATRTAPVTPGAVPAEVAEAFRGRVRRRGEHRIWQGTADKGTTPVFYVDYTRYAARRVAWVLHHGTEPVGLIKTTCRVPLCVHGPHLTDERSRQAEHVLYAAVVHGIALTDYCGNGHDRAEWGYVRADGEIGCRGCDNARRRRCNATTSAQEGAAPA